MSANRLENTLRRPRKRLGWTWQACALLALMLCLPGCVHRGIHTLSWGTTFPRRNGTIGLRACHGTPDPWAHGYTVWRPLGADCTQWTQPVDGAVETDVANAEGEPTLAPRAKPLQDSEPSSLLPGPEDRLLPGVDESKPLPPDVPAGPTKPPIPMSEPVIPPEQPQPTDDQVRRLSKPPQSQP